MSVVDAPAALRRCAPAGQPPAGAAPAEKR
jgi:hypothetical protein